MEEFNEEKYSEAISRLETVVDSEGVGSLAFSDGQLVMFSLTMLKTLIAAAEAKEQTRVFLFVNTQDQVEETNEQA